MVYELFFRNNVMFVRARKAGRAKDFQEGMDRA